MRILINVGNGIGDTAIMLPFVATVKRFDPTGTIDIYIKGIGQNYKLNKEMLETQNYIDRYLYYNGRKFFHNLRFILQVAFRNYDYCVFSPDITVKKITLRKIPWRYLIARISGGYMIGNEKNFPYGWLDRPIAIPQNTNIAQQWMYYLDCLGLPQQPLYNIMHVQTEVISPVYRRFFSSNYNIIGICIGTGTTLLHDGEASKSLNIKQWGYQNWEHLSNMLLDDGCRIVLLGGRKEAEESCNAFKTLLHRHDRILDLIGKATISESLAVISLCSLIVGGDTGLMHCAAALGKRTISLFGPTDPEVYLPYSNNSTAISLHMPCSPCNGKKDALFCTRECMVGIPVKTVHETICKSLSLAGDTI